MTTKLGPVSYTSLDSESILQEMVGRIPSLTNRWTDYNSTDAGVVLLELFSWVLDKMIYSLDYKANEAFFVLAQELENVYAHARLIGYHPHGVISASTLLEVGLENAPHLRRVEIPRFLRCATSRDELILFATTTRTVIPEGESSVLVGARQGTPAELLSATSGEPSQRFLLDNEADEISIEVVVDEIVWVSVASFVASQASDRHYMVEHGADGRVEVIFGDGSFGLVPSVSARSNVRVSYLISSGSSGNVGPGAIRTILDNVTDVSGQKVSLTVINTTAATGGTGREDIEHIRRQAPAELSALFRAMTRADYVALSEGFDGIAKAQAWGEQEGNPPEYRMMNWVQVVVAPDGVTREVLLEDPSGAMPSAQLKIDLQQYLHDRACITTRIKVNDPVYRPIDLEADIYYADGFLLANVRAAVEDLIFEFFDFAVVSFGQEIRKSNIIRLLDSAEGVEYSTLNIMRTSESTVAVESVIVSRLYELPYLRTFLLTLRRAERLPTPTLVYPSPPIQQAPRD